MSSKVAKCTLLMLEGGLDWGAYQQANIVAEFYGCTKVRYIHQHNKLPIKNRKKYMQLSNANFACTTRTWKLASCLSRLNLLLCNY